MSVLMHDIDFSEAGNSGDYVLDGWGTPEGGHTWSIGLQSRLKFTTTDPTQPLVLVMRAKPWLHAPEIDRQRVVLGIDDQAIGVVDLVEDSVFALSLPPGGSDRVLMIGHADSDRSAAYDVYRNGESMGLMMRWIRLFQPASRSPASAASLPPIPGRLEDGSLPAAIEAATGQTMAQLMGRFESLGEWCHFGKLQQRFGCDRPTLLRFAGLHLPDLVHGLVKRFDGIAKPGAMEVFHAPTTPDLFDMHDRTYRIWWHTNRSVLETNASSIMRDEQVRMGYLQRKFAKTLQDGRRIFVLTVPVSDNEALAAFMALDLWARNTLLFVTQDSARPPGSVERVAGGVLRGTIDATDVPKRGTEAVWLSVLANASLLAEQTSHRADSVRLRST